AANVDTEFIRARSEAALERAHHGSSDSRRMPIHSHHRAQRLKPEWIAQAREKRRRTIITNNYFGDCGAEFGHPLGQPLRHASAVQRQIGNSGTLHDADCLLQECGKQASMYEASLCASASRRGARTPLSAIEREAQKISRR